MRNFLKSVLKGLAALALSDAAVSTTATPADAQIRFGGGGFHGGMGGFGGFHGMGGGMWRGGMGGWHGGSLAGSGWGDGWRNGGWGGYGGWGGGWRNAGWGYGGRGSGYRGYWNGCWNCGYYNNDWWWAPALASGMIVGAAASYPYYSQGYYPNLRLRYQLRLRQRLLGSSARL